MSISQDKLAVIESGDFAPGTVQLRDEHDARVVLNPTPSTDPNDPLNWTNWRKWQQTVILCIYTMLVDSCLTISTPMWAVMSDEEPTQFSMLNLNNSYAAGTGALAVGCLLFVPFALRYGRRPVYVLTCAIITAMAAWSAKMTTSGELFATQIIMNLVGVVNQALFGVSIGDMFYVYQRGLLNGLYVAMTVVGLTFPLNFLAPVAAGYVTTNQGWRWGYWWVAILSGATFLVMVLFLEETKYNRAELSVHDAARGHSQTRSELKQDGTVSVSEANVVPCSVSGEHIDHSIPMKTYWQRMSLTQASPGQSWSAILQHFWLPFAITGSIPAVMFCSVVYGFGFSCLSIVLVTQAQLYPEAPYNFSPVGVGNVIIAPAIGGILGSIVGGVVTDWFIMRLAAKRGGVYEPETRLYLFAPIALAMPAGLLLYGLPIAKGLPWIITCVGSAMVMFALAGCSSIAVTYIQDSYLHILGDTLVGISFVRNSIATALIFALPAWIDGMGVYDTFVLLSCLAAVIYSSVILFVIWGKKWRVKTASRYFAYAQRQPGFHMME